MNHKGLGILLDGQFIKRAQGTEYHDIFTTLA